MTSPKQIEANRRNSLKSTGPRTEAGKQASRCNAVRHGLTAETVIGALEDAEDYKAFEVAVTADYDAQSAVERELVLRLASLLWRLRRATTIETELFEIQADHLSEFRKARQISSGSRGVVYALFNASSEGPSPSPDHAQRRARGRPPLILNSPVVSCGFRTSPIMLSTASIAMKPPFGAELGRFFMHSTIWIAPNHKKECTVSGLAANKNPETSGAKIERARAATRMGYQLMTALRRWLLIFALVALVVTVSYFWLDRPLAMFLHNQRPHIPRMLTQIPDPLTWVAAIIFCAWIASDRATVIEDANCITRLQPKSSGSRND